MKHKRIIAFVGFLFLLFFVLVFKHTFCRLPFRIVNLVKLKNFSIYCFFFPWIFKFGRGLSRDSRCCCLFCFINSWWEMATFSCRRFLRVVSFPCLGNRGRCSEGNKLHVGGCVPVKSSMYAFLKPGGCGLALRTFASKAKGTKNDPQKSGMPISILCCEALVECNCAESVFCTTNLCCTYRVEKMFFCLFVCCNCLLLCRTLYVCFEFLQRSGRRTIRAKKTTLLRLNW